MSHAFRISTACVGSSLRLRPFGEAGGGLRVRFRGSRVAAAPPETMALLGLFVCAAGAAVASVSAIYLGEFVLRYGLLWRCSVQAWRAWQPGALETWIFFTLSMNRAVFGGFYASGLLCLVAWASQTSGQILLCEG